MFLTLLSDWVQLNGKEKIVYRGWQNEGQKKGVSDKHMISVFFKGTRKELHFNFS